MPAQGISPQVLLDHGPFVRALALSLIGDEHGAEDITQEAWAVALERRAPPSGAGAWLGGVARNL
ncbi:MAG: sigma factor [Planctomycetota bacterium]